jgi:hypothetical protein
VPSYCCGQDWTEAATSLSKSLLKRPLQYDNDMATGSPCHCCTSTPLSKWPDEEPTPCERVPTLSEAEVFGASRSLTEFPTILKVGVCSTQLLLKILLLVHHPVINRTTFQGRPWDYPAAVGASQDFSSFKPPGPPSPPPLSAPAAKVRSSQPLQTEVEAVWTTSRWTAVFQLLTNDGI